MVYSHCCVEYLRVINENSGWEYLRIVDETSDGGSLVSSSFSIAKYAYLSGRRLS